MVGSADKFLYCTIPGITKKSRVYGMRSLPSLKSAAERLRLSLQISLRWNSNAEPIDIRYILLTTLQHNINLDFFSSKLLDFDDKFCFVYLVYEVSATRKNRNYLSNLKILGVLNRLVSVKRSTSSLIGRNSQTGFLHETLFRFVRMGSAAATANSRKFAPMGEVVIE